MIIKLTPDEVKKYVAVALNLHSGAFDLEIVAVETGVLVALRTALNENPEFNCGHKISAIKRFRELCPRLLDRDGYSCVIGLADAKWAVENVAEAIRNLETTGKLRA